MDALKGAIGRAERAGSAVSALMIDLDRFKPVNDRYGHVVGDLVLKEVARRLEATLRSGELCARFGGDEFVVIMETPRGAAAAQRIAKRIIDALSNPMTVDGVPLRIGATVGVASYPEDALDGDELLRMADVALYRAKEEGRGRAKDYHPAMDADLDERAQLEDDLRAAIADGQITPYFQPLIDLETGAINGFEVLSRWNHPTRGLLKPAEFIALAEKTGLISDLTFALLRAACRAAKAMPERLKLAINIAAPQIEDEWLAEKVMAVLTDVGFPASRLEVELTENALVTDLAAAKRVITSLKNLGVGVALDDFGTGYSSLYYLSELPFDKIKIDRSFITDLDDKSENARVVDAIVGLGRSLGVPTLAEGVETESAATYLRGIGCAAAQGWHYSKAVPADVAQTLVGSTEGDAAVERRNTA